MRCESRTGLAALKLAQAANCERILAIKAEFDVLRAEWLAIRAVKFSPDQPRDERGRWTDGTSEIEVGSDAFGIAPDGSRVESIAECTGISAHALKRMQERGITPDSVIGALTNPIQIIPQSNGNTLYIGASAKVVLSPNGWMVTCY